ncbi:DUF2470 domain-containing protein [Streptacidiphilus rugosus]|uniref:DUF2470 domain-containing protein n=1 Tax=Streptacidiphilus rugosus TaxID=405783 RepID=UPI00055B63E3|nr:DUF2470 domain-containing protein [Streptacidiphilus rugosus]
MSHARSAEPTPAERARSILAGATSLTATAVGVQVAHLEMRAFEANGRLLLVEPPGGVLRAALREAPRQGAAVGLDFTDVAPAPVRDRVRARLSLRGWLGPAEQLGPAGTAMLGFRCAAAELTENGSTQQIGPDELRQAEPDPLADREAVLLSHLVDRHLDAVAALARLVDSRLLLGVARVHPLRLDRHGIVLRLERARTQQDVRLPFRARLDHPDDAGLRIQELLADAHACPRRHRAPTRP